MKREIHVPYTVEQDEDGVLAAQAAPGPDAFANGQADTRDEAVADLRAAIVMLIGEVGVPDELVVTVEVE